MFTKSYQKIISGFEKTIKECEDLMYQNQKQSQEAAARIATLEEEIENQTDLLASLTAEGKLAASLQGKLITLIEG